MIYTAFQRIRFVQTEFSSNIVIVDTSPIFDLNTMKTNRWDLADLLRAIHMGQARSTGADIFFQTDSMFFGTDADLYLRNALLEYESIVLPSPVDSVFDIKESVRQCNIYLHDGYRVPVYNEGYFSLPFLMDTEYDENYSNPYYFQYAADTEVIRKKGLILNAMDLLTLWANPDLSEEEKQDELSLYLGGRFVILGFCHSLLHVDYHNTPLGQQPGIVVWANVLNSMIHPENQIQYFPLFSGILVIFLLTFIVMWLNHIYKNYPYFYSICYGFVIILSMFLIPIIAYKAMDLFHVFLPVFSLLIVVAIGHPVLIYFQKMAPLIIIMHNRSVLKQLPRIFQKSYLAWLKEVSPYRKLLIAFLYIEDQLRILSWIGLAQVQYYNIDIKSHSGKFPEKFNWKTMSFGQWHGFLRNLNIILKDYDQISDTWKSIYTERKSNHWVANSLFECMDSNIGAFLEMNQVASSEENKDIARSGLLNQLIKIVNRIRNSTIYDIISPRATINLQENTDYEGSLVHLRNTMIHNDQVFLSQKHNEVYLPVLKQIVTGFTKTFIEIWKHCFYDQKQNKWIFQNDSDSIPLSPYFEQILSTQTDSEMLFLLRSFNYKNGQMIYHDEQSRHVQKLKDDELVSVILSLLYL